MIKPNGNECYEDGNLSQHLCVLKVFVKKTWLNSFVVLVFARAVSLKLSFNSVIENLADFNTRVDPNRLNAEDLKSPVAAKSNVSESSSYVNEKP